MKSAVEDSQSTNAMPISGRKRLKMFSEERDGSIACCGRVGDESSKKKQKIAVDYSDPFAIPDLPGGFDCGKYGSVTKDIEDLLARMKFLKPDFAIHNMSVGEEKNQSEKEPRLPSQQVSLLPHHAVIVLDDDPITKDVAAALPVVIIDSDDEDSEVPRPSNLLQEVVTAKPNGEHHISDLLVKDGLDSSWSTKEEGALASETEVREGKDFYVAESNCLKKEKGPLSSATEVGEEKGFCVVESNCPRKEEGFLSDETEVREEKYVADSNYSTKVEGALACKSEVKEEEGLNVVKSNCPKVEEVPLAGETGVREDKVYFADSNCPTKAEGPLASETKIKEQKGFFITEINCPEKEEGAVASETEVREVKGYYVGVQDDEATDEAYYQTNIQDDGLGDIWKEMTIALECSKDIVEDPSSDEYASESGGDCDHSFVLKDDLGYVCRVCGVIDRGIETIFDFQYSKTKTTRTYKSESWNRESTEVFADGMKLSEHEFIATKISAHTWHRKEMKPHQVEGFNFLARNLAVDNPGGCILAHAPGSGKTFMVLSFLQSFLEKNPHARPLVVLPKGIMANWKKEFQIWKVEDIPLFDLYTAKGDNRSQQLSVLKQWVEQKSILFVGYQQFSSIICSCEESQVLAACQKILLEVPSILILDEGHTPRNDETDVLNSLAKVQTPCKVVLSGTLYQNHVQEVFNILNLVRPRFLRSDTSRVIKKRIMSRVQISGVRKHVKSNEELAFYDLVEHTLQKDEDLRRKIHVIQDLREMTSKVLHYYKGDFSDELPGLEDFTVLLNLSAKQKPEVEKLKRLLMFKRNSVGSAVFLHPQLRYFSAAAGEKPLVDEKMDEILRTIDVRDGVKAKFFLNLLNLCESADEKLLVFSQYLPPLKFMERLAMKVKGWSRGKETFMISGDSNSELRECSMDQFNTSSDAKVFFGSIKACGEGISLVGASRLLILDVHLNPSVTRQAIGRAFRRGQKRKVYTYRLVAADSHEEEDHVTSVKKESISKMWFEWDELSRDRVFELKTVDVNDSGDPFLESPLLREDIKVLYKR